MADEGYIKFRCEWIKAEPLLMPDILRLNRWRDELFGYGLIGAYSEGLGFGNISQRQENSNEFIITGSATGSLPLLEERHYTLVREYDIERNYLRCEGPIKASSESLTHGAVYLAAPEVKGVIHVHNLSLWERLIDRVPTSSKTADYGTPEMAREVMRLVGRERANDALNGIIVMAGHKEGIISYGRCLDEAGELLLRLYFEE